MTCPTCNGCGEVVRLLVTYDSKGNEYSTQQASPCSACGGKGEV